MDYFHFNVYVLVSDWGRLKGILRYYYLFWKKNVIINFTLIEKNHKYLKRFELMKSALVCEILALCNYSTYLQLTLLFQGGRRYMDIFIHDYWCKCLPICMACHIRYSKKHILLDIGHLKVNSTLLLSPYGTLNIRIFFWPPVIHIAGRHDGNYDIVLFTWLQH